MQKYSLAAAKPVINFSGPSINKQKLIEVRRNTIMIRMNERLAQHEALQTLPLNGHQDFDDAMYAKTVEAA